MEIKKPDHNYLILTHPDTGERIPFASCYTGLSADVIEFGAVRMYTFFDCLYATLDDTIVYHERMLELLKNKKAQAQGIIKR
jgi:hypothetical protein